MFFSSCHIIGHSLSNYNRNRRVDDVKVQKKVVQKYVSKKHESVLKDQVTDFNKAPASEVVPDMPATNKGKEVIVEPSPIRKNVVQGETSIRNHIDMPPRYDAVVHGLDMMIDVKLRIASQENQIKSPVANLDDQLNKDSTLNDEEEIENVFDEMQFHNDGVTDNALKDLDRVSNTFSGEEQDMHVDDTVVNSKDSLSGNNVVTPNVHPNPVVVKDLEALKGRLWGDEEEPDSIEDNSKSSSVNPNEFTSPLNEKDVLEQDSGFTKVLSRSQKKKLRKKQIANEKKNGYITRSRDASSSLVFFF